jgi:hypothetical protein
MFRKMLEDDRRRAGWSVGQTAWRLGRSVREYREIEAGERRRRGRRGTGSASCSAGLRRSQPTRWVLLTKPTPRRTVIQQARTLFETNFERVANEPEAGRLEAASLLRAAEALRPLMDRDAAAFEQGAVGDPVDHPVGHVYMLLAGLAIENLVKARVVSINGGSGSKPGRLSAEVKTHDLLQLFDMAGLALSDDEAYSPERLEAFVEWAGRYPLGAKSHDHLPRQAPGGGGAPLDVRFSTDMDAIEALLARLGTTS